MITIEKVRAATLPLSTPLSKFATKTSNKEEERSKILPEYEEKINERLSGKIHTSLGNLVREDQKVGDNSRDKIEKGIEKEVMLNGEKKSGVSSRSKVSQRPLLACQIHAQRKFSNDSNETIKKTKTKGIAKEKSKPKSENQMKDDKSSRAVERL